MKNRKPLPRSTKPIRRSALPRATRTSKRFAKHRNDAYREYVRQHWCVLAGHPEHLCVGSVQCCHVKPRSTGGSDVGNCWPGCALAHARQHEMGVKRFEERYGVELASVAAKLGESWRGALTNQVGETP